MNHELDFPAGIWEPFAKSRPPVRCSPGYLIYLQNTQATCFYYLKSGKVKSFIQSEDGGERVLNLYTAGSLFGEASFFDELPRVSSAVALTPCEYVSIDPELVAQGKISEYCTRTWTIWRRRLTRRIMWRLRSWIINSILA